MTALIYNMDRLSLMNCFQIFGSYLGLAVKDFDIAQTKGWFIKGHGRF